MFIPETRQSISLHVGDRRRQVEEAQLQSSVGIYLGVSSEHFPQGNIYQEIENI